MTQRSSPNSFFSYCPFFFKKDTSALALRDASTDSGAFLQNLDALLTWVCEIGELKANQKPPSSEVKVVKAQLQEQKVCYLQHHINSLFCGKKNVFVVLHRGSAQWFTDRKWCRDQGNAQIASFVLDVQLYSVLNRWCSRLQ